ncbi:hypothetical protein ACFQGW_06800 [Xanthomonas theicola]
MLLKHLFDGSALVPLEIVPFRRNIGMKRLFDSLARWVQALGGRKLGYIYSY